MRRMGFGSPGIEGPVRDWASYHPAVAQQPPARYRPTWHVGHLVYQGGVPILKRSSLTGGGFYPVRDGFAGREAPGTQPYVTPVSSMMGSGTMPSRPNFLTRLFGGASGPNQ